MSRAVALLVGVALLVAGCGDTGGSQSTQKERRGSAGVRGAAGLPARFDGVPQSGAFLGSPRAPFTLIEFADLQCPYCAQFDRDVLPAVIDRFVRPGRLRLELRVLRGAGSSLLDCVETTMAITTMSAAAAPASASVRRRRVRRSAAR